jgi:hypothetical protein
MLVTVAPVGLPRIPMLRAVPEIGRADDGLVEIVAFRRNVTPAE